MAIKYLGKVKDTKNEGEVEMKVGCSGDVKTGCEEVPGVTVLKHGTSLNAIIEPIVHETVEDDLGTHDEIIEALMKEDIVEVTPQANAESVKTKNQIRMHPSKGASKHEFTLAKSRGQIRKRAKKQEFSIYNTLWCKKIMIPMEIVEKARLSELIQVGFTEEGVILGKVLSADKKESGYFRITRHGSMYTLYSSSLVEELTQKFNLKFGKGSLKFTGVEYITANRRKAVLIKLA